MSQIHDEEFPVCESLGAAEVRRRLATNQVPIVKRAIWEEWLKLKSGDAAERAEARAEEGLVISRRALRVSIAAIIFSVVTAIAVALVEYFGARTH